MQNDIDPFIDVRELMKRAHVAAPCSVRWQDMTGDEKRRLCAQCNCYVLKAAAMTDEEVLEAITRAATGQRVCMQFYKRADGTFLTRNCPVGLAAIRQRARRVASWAIGMLSALLSSAISTAQANEDVFIDDHFCDDDAAVTSAANTAGGTTSKARWHGAVQSDQLESQSTPEAGADASSHKPVYPSLRLSGYLGFHKYTDEEIAAQKEAVEKARQQCGATASNELGTALAKLSDQLRGRDEFDQALQCSLEALKIFETNGSWRNAGFSAGRIAILYDLFEDAPKVKKYKKLQHTYRARADALQAKNNPVGVKQGNNLFVRTYDAAKD